MKLDLKLRDLNTGEITHEGFDDEAATTAWLAARPPFVEVLGLATQGVPSEVSNRLRAAMRALDDDEKALSRKLEAQAEAASLKREEEKIKTEAAAAEAHKLAMKTADPNRLMDVHWTYDRGMELSDVADTRAITDEAREATLAWIRERDEWVESRGQIVGDAKVSVWPGPIPAAEKGERVKRGTFIPVTAPKKG